MSIEDDLRDHQAREDSRITECEHESGERYRMWDSDGCGYIIWRCDLCGYEEVDTMP